MAGNRNAPAFWANKPEEHARKISDVLAGVMKGQQNNDFGASLRATPEVTTEILSEFARPGQRAFLSPENSAAALDFSQGTTWAVVETGKIIIHHAAGAAGRNYSALLQG